MTQKNIAVLGNILSNFTLDYNRIVHGTFEDLASKAIGEDEYGKEAKAVIEGIRILQKRILETIPSAEISKELKEKQTTNFEKMINIPVSVFENYPFIGNMPKS